METNPIDKLFDDVHKLSEITKAESDALLAEYGYDVNDIYSQALVLVRHLRTQSKIRLTVSKLSNDQQSAVKELAYALNQDSGPTYRSSCQEAFRLLTGLDGYDYRDPQWTARYFDNQLK